MGVADGDCFRASLCKRDGIVGVAIDFFGKAPSLP